VTPSSRAVLALMVVAAICVLAFAAIRFRYATQMVHVSNGQAQVEVTDRWTGNVMLCELYGTYPTDCDSELNINALHSALPAPSERATTSSPKLTPEQCKAFESLHQGIPLECVTK